MIKRSGTLGRNWYFFPPPPLPLLFKSCCSVLMLIMYNVSKVLKEVLLINLMHSVVAHVILTWLKLVEGYGGLRRKYLKQALLAE